jgi:hypothetical protein
LRDVTTGTDLLGERSAAEQAPAERIIGQRESATADAGRRWHRERSKARHAEKASHLPSPTCQKKDAQCGANHTDPRGGSTIPGVTLGIDWRWRSGRLGERCDDCGDSNLRGRSIVAEPEVGGLLCTRCAIHGGVSMFARQSPTRKPPAQLELAAA